MRRRFAAILWDVPAELDTDTLWLETFDAPDEAIEMLCSRCHGTQRWAVVDLNDLRVVEEGPKPPASGPGAGGVLAGPALRRVL
jgi:hypothetical protein